jgi:hypothetical protein
MEIGFDTAERGEQFEESDAAAAPEGGEENDERGRLDDGDGQDEAADYDGAESDETDSRAGGDEREGEGDEDEEGAAAREEGERTPSVFISYNDNPQDRRIAAQLYRELSPHYEVFYDKETILPGQVYAEVTNSWLQRVDFIIVLISAKSVESQWVITELEVAYERYQRENRPAIIPIHFAYAGDYKISMRAYASDYDLAMRAYIRRFQAVFWDEHNTAAFIERLHAAIGNRPLPLTRSSITGMEGLLVGENRRARGRAAFVPAALAAAEGELDKKKLLWVTGDADIRNYVALSVAARQQAAALYEVTKSRTWCEVNNSGVAGAAILLRDTLPAAQFQASAGEELFALRSLIERNNVIIATTSDEEFERALPEMRRYEFGDPAHLSVSRTSYDYAAKLRAFNAALDFSLRAGDLSGEQYAWAAELADESPRADAPAEANPAGRADQLRQREGRARFREVVTRWSPSDIERFITISLPRARRREDVARLLQRNAALEDEVHAWFLSLDDTTRCFVLALATFPEVDDDRLWGMYKSIVEDLRALNPNLSLTPFGICRQRAAPYVSAEGPIYITDERVTEAIRQEVARSYREYFIELTPRIMEWSVPAGRGDKAPEAKAQRKVKIKEGREVRLAVARMVGIVGRMGLEDLLEILDHWATDPDYHVRLSVAVALRQTAQSPTGVNHALSLMEEWCRDVSAKGSARLRPLAAAIALGAIASAAPEQYAVPRALNCFRRLARSARPDVRFHVSIALKQVARHVSLAALESILGRIASGDRKAATRINTAAALHEARSRADERASEEVERLCEQWLLTGDAGRRWVAACALVMAHDARCEDDRLRALLEQGEADATLASVFAEMVDNEYLGRTAEETFCRLVMEVEGRAWENLRAGLARLHLTKLEKRLLPRLRADATPLMDERLTEVRAEVLRRRLTQPAQFGAVLRVWLWQEQPAIAEVYKAVALLLDEGPEGCRPEVVRALAEHFRHDQRVGGEVLARLEAMAPSHLAPVARQARVEALGEMLADYESLVKFAAEGLERHNGANGLGAALEILSGEGGGRRPELCHALARAYRADPGLTSSLMRKLRASGSALLARLSQDVIFRLLADDLAAPAAFVSRLAALIDEGPHEAREALQALNLLAVPEPQGRRRALVNALAAEQAEREGEVEELLSSPELQAWPNLAGLPGEVSRVVFLRQVFNPRKVINFIKKHVGVSGM